MKLTGGCHCGTVTFEVESKTPYPYMRCYCSICRKTSGSGGYAINLGADAGSLKMSGAEFKGIYNAVIDGKTSPANRSYCTSCGTHLWVWDPRWPDLLHPHAGVVNTPLPSPPEIVHIMLKDKPDWVVVPEGIGHIHFDGYPDLTIEDWHKSHGLFEKKD